MSQHSFHARGYHVLCGWDRPLQGFFLVIEKSDELQYSNLFEDDPHPKSFDVFLIVLARFGIPVPEQILTALDEDKAANAGNLYHRWQEGHLIETRG
ncbi:hypothetical protein [Vibrio crassostreae]|uniref:hypothetical protein n=1 Tax=Vibrio crassostreae TaxID=246167 RepID=UPI00030B7252|nr:MULTISPECIES: hypothetical protein [Vibrio]OEF69953.1 hypothetical protein A152_17750 [Vibrio tasmaniensis 1F-187]TCT93465.1 hypothetical protein EDB47_1644 [Vibrio crassostreae]CAK2159495.1 conserved hypothetical protein [Vibrio crassostreae]CAK3041963.1 conserved hypothetical protein [Vibrio crassostreae]CAK3043334.1 conserved hypothetical protein [Vibrio crassostreae]